MPNSFRRTVVASLICLAVPTDAQPASAPAKSIEAYVKPYVDTRNFSGVITVAKANRAIFAKSYGSSDFVGGVPNRLDTRFHIASMSMQFTAAAALRLVQAGKLSLDEPVSSFVPDLPNGGKITIRHLLTQTSGIRDINGLPQYDDLLKSHQTPLALVDKIRGLPAEHEPGTFGREEHSAYNLLALIIERRTGLPFATAVKHLVFGPLQMADSGIDDDDLRAGPEFAVGHAPRGTQEVEPAERIHWSAKAGNASAYTTAGDELRFVRGMFDPRFLRADLRDAVFDLSSRVGYGWFKSNSTRFGQPVYSMNGRAPGFASALIYVPREQLAVVAFSNIYASFTSDIAGDVPPLCSACRINR